MKNVLNKGWEINLLQVARLQEDKRGHVSASLGVDGRNFCHLFKKRSPQPRRLPLRSLRAHEPRVQVISGRGLTLTASHGRYRMCIYVQRDKEPRRLTATAGARWRGKLDLLVAGAQSDTLSLSLHAGEAECRSAPPLRCEMTTQWGETLSEKLFFFLRLGTRQAHAPPQSVHCTENKRVPASLNSSHRQQPCNCQFHAWLIVITRRETKKEVGGERNAFQD